MANSAECQVWRWMGRVFFDHHVMIKVPVTRFTLPRDKQNSAHWYQLLSGVYCTFTVCESDGHVVGCVDVLGPHGLPSSNVQLKLALLSQCGIAYWVVKPGNLPDLAEIRTEFLGSAAAASETRKEDAAINLARQKLRAEVGRQRHQRHGASAGPDSKGTPAFAAGSEGTADSSFSSGAWQQPNSFVAPLDSRPTKLR
jgi:hypothetical protein